MIRDISLEEISDGRLYDLNDMVKAGCNECQDCSACCHGMGTSIILDPLDVHRLQVHLQMTFEQLMERHLELNVVDGVILPNLKMDDAAYACTFLDKTERCSIHASRPGICRLFPLGRYYEDMKFRYFLQIHECMYQNRTKVKVRKWIDTPEPSTYDAYITAWHFLQKRVQKTLANEPEGNLKKTVNLYLLKLFYVTPYGETGDFYGEFLQRVAEAEKTGFLSEDT